MFLKITKKILFSIIIILLLSSPAKASHPVYSYDTAGEYRWYKNGNYLVNDVDAYKDKKLTKLSIFYNNPKNGVMYEGDMDRIGSDKKLGNFTVYSLESTSNDQNSNDFPVGEEIKHVYYVLFNEDTKKVYDIDHIPNPLPAAYVNRYKFWINGNSNQEVYFLHSEGGGDVWYGDYLAKIGKDVKDKKPGLSTISNPPQPPASSGVTATGTTTPGSTTTTTGECNINPVCKPREPTDPAWMTSFDKEKTVSESLKQGNIATAWALSLDVVNVLAIFMLLAIAFANILHIGEREMFSFKRMIPAFVIGLIAANFSHLICRAIIDFAGMLMNFFVPKEHAVDVAANIYTGMYGGWTGAAAGGAIMFGTGAVTIVALFLGAGIIACGPILIGLIILGIPVLITLILWFLLAARTYVLWFLVILSPIAFFGMFFDPLKRTIEKWWGWFLPWTFMGPIAYFFIYLAEGFAKDTTGYNSVSGCFDPSNADQVGGFTKYIIVNVLLILAVYVPYALGQKIGMGLWAGIGKFAGGMGLWAGAGTGAAGLRAAGLKKVQNPLTLPALPRGWETSAPGMLWQGIREADVAATSKQLQKTVERLPGGRDLNRNVNREWGIKNGDNFAKGSGWDVGGLGADEDRFVNASLNAGHIKLGSDASREDVNILAFRMQRLRQLTDLDDRRDARGNVIKGHELLKFSDVYGPGKDLMGVEEEIHKKSGGRINRKRFTAIRKQVDEEVSAAREARPPSRKSRARAYLAEDIMNGTAETLDGDLREGNLGYMASRRTTEKGHGEAGPMNP